MFTGIILRHRGMPGPTTQPAGCMASCSTATCSQRRVGIPAAKAHKPTRLHPNGLLVAAAAGDDYRPTGPRQPSSAESTAGKGASMAQERRGADAAVGPSAEGTAPQQQYPRVHEGRRSQEWRQRQTADQTSLWGTFIKVVGTFVLMGRGYAAAALQLLGELTYPSPKGIARLTLAVLLSSAALTLLVFGLDRAYMHVLLPPVARKLAARS